MLEAEVATTVLLRSTVAGGGNAQGVQNSDLPAGGTLQMLFPSLHFLGLCLCNLAANYLCTSLPTKSQVPSSLSLSALLLTVCSSPVLPDLRSIQYPSLPGWLEASPQSLLPLPSPDLRRHPSTHDLLRLSLIQLPRTENHTYLRAQATASWGGGGGSDWKQGRDFRRRGGSRQQVAMAW